MVHCVQSRPACTVYSTVYSVLRSVALHNILCRLACFVHNWPHSPKFQIIPSQLSQTTDRSAGLCIQSLGLSPFFYCTVSTSDWPEWPLDVTFIHYWEDFFHCYVTYLHRLVNVNFWEETRVGICVTCARLGLYTELPEIAAILPAWFEHFRTYLHNRLVLIARWLVYSTFKLIWELPALFFVLVYSTSGLGSVQYYMCFSTLRLVDSNSWLEYVSTVGTFALVYSTSVLVYGNNRIDYHTSWHIFSFSRLLTVLLKGFQPFQAYLLYAQACVTS